jgi:hypothetical protein
LEVEASGHMLAQLLRGAPLPAVDGNLQQRQVVCKEGMCEADSSNKGDVCQQRVCQLRRQRGEERCAELS